MADTEILDKPGEKIPVDYKEKMGNYFPVTFQVLGYFFLLVSLYLFLDLRFIMALVLLVAGLFIAFTTHGIQINFSNKMYKEYWGPFHWTFGKWKHLTGLDYISVFNAKISQNIVSQTQAIKLEDQEYQVNLILDNRQRITVLATKNKDKAFELAKTFASNWDLKIYDASDPGNHRWIA